MHFVIAWCIDCLVHCLKFISLFCLLFLTASFTGHITALWTFGVSSCNRLLARQVIQDGFLATFNAQQVANTVWAFAALEVQDGVLLTHVARRILDEGFLDTFRPVELCQVVWGFAALDAHSEALMRRIAARLLRDDGFLGTFSGPLIANIAWGYAMLGHHHPALMEAIAARLLHGGVLPALSYQAAADVAWAFGALGIDNEPLMEGLLEHVRSFRVRAAAPVPGDRAALPPGGSAPVDDSAGALGGAPAAESERADGESE